MNKLAINFLLLSACSFSQLVYADCKPNSTITVPSLYYDLSADFSSASMVVAKTDKTTFPGTFSCSSPGLFFPNAIGIASPFNGRTATIGFHGGKQFVQVTMTALGKDRVTNLARGTHPASNLNNNFSLQFSLLKSKPSGNYTEVAGDTVVISPFILVSDASSLGILVWLVRIVLKLVEFLLTWQWPVDENDIFLQPITIKYNPIATTCDFSNKGLVVNLPIVSISDIKNIDRPGYQPFTLNFSCSDLLAGNKTTRNIAMFLASNNLHSADKTVLINTTQQGAKGVGHEFRNLQKRSINLKTRKNQGVHILSGYPCIKDIYKTFLQVSSLRYSGLALSEVSPSPLSHDTVSRWLKSRCFRPKDLWRLVEPSIDKKSPCVLIADDTLIAKTRSKKIVMVHYQYSGNEHEVIAGIGLVNLLWHDLTKVESIPINYLIYDKDSDGKTKNTHFSEMLTLAKKRGIMPEAVVMDAWYSSLDNLKSIRSHGWIWVTTLRKNRIVNHNKQLNKLDISEEGTSIHLRGYGWVTVFKFTAKNGRIDYIVTNKENPTRQYLKSIMDARWSVEVYHREVKQNCGIERCQARTSRAQRNHIFLAISAWFEQHKRRISEKITLYQQNWDVIKSAITEQIRVLLAYPN